ncbi:hypothetical protein RCL1_006911 [Eukaryota sp. TZLM3-RCL]
MIICGCYERSLLGFDFQDSTLVPVFQHVSHVDAVKAVTSCSRYFASGSTDEVVHIFDAVKRKELSSLFCHSASVEAIQFTPNKTFLLSGDVSGRLCLVRTSDFNLVTSISLDSSIVSISVHPTSKIAVVLTKDGGFHIIDVASFRILGQKLVESEPIKCIFSKDGSKAVIVTIKNLVIVDLNSEAELVVSMPGPSKDVCLFNDLLVITNGKNVGIYNFQGEKLGVEFVYSQRIRTLSALGRNHIVITGSTGLLSVYSVVIEQSVPVRLELVCFKDLGCRPTCLCIV